MDCVEGAARRRLYACLARASTPAARAARSGESRKQRRMACEWCERPQAVCVCHALPRGAAAVDGATGAPSPLRVPGCRVIVLQHPAEAARGHISTVPLLRLCIAETHVLVGEFFPPCGAAVDDSTATCASPLLDEALRDPGTILFFPGKGSVPLESVVGAGEGEGAGAARTLLLVDGTWRHAKHILACNPRLLDATRARGGPVARVYVQREEPGGYGFRREPFSHGLSTAEAVAEALPLLGACAAAAALRRAFRAMVAAQTRFLPATPRPPRGHVAARCVAAGAAAGAAGGAARAGPARTRRYRLFRRRVRPDGDTDLIPEAEGSGPMLCTYSEACVVRDRVNAARVGRGKSSRCFALAVEDDGVTPARRSARSRDAAAAPGAANPLQ